MRTAEQGKPRDLYEGGDATGKGCGLYWLSYSAGLDYQPLEHAEVRELLVLGLIRPKWDDQPGLNYFRLS